MVFFEHRVVFANGGIVGSVQLGDMRLDFSRHLKGRVLPAEALFPIGDNVVAERRTVARCGALLGGALSDIRMHDDQRGVIELLLCFIERGTDRVDVLSVRNVQHLPAVGGEARADVLGEGGIGAALDGDLVAVVNGDKLAEPHGAGKGSRFGHNALHHAAVADERRGVIIENGIAVAVKNCGKMPFCHSHADGHSKALTERAGGSLNAGGMGIFRMPRSSASELAEGLDIVDGDVITEKMQKRIVQHGGMPRAEDKAIAAEPILLRGLLPELLEDSKRDRRSAYRHAGMAALCLLNGVRT